VDAHAHGEGFAVRPLPGVEGVLRRHRRLDRVRRRAEGEEVRVSLRVDDLAADRGERE
jgi:hypothetical protein